jgi:hypothetical protein
VHYQLVLLPFRNCFYGAFENAALIESVNAPAQIKTNDRSQSLSAISLDFSAKVCMLCVPANNTRNAFRSRIPLRTGIQTAHSA